MESIPAEIEERFKVLQPLASSPTGALFRVEDMRGGRQGVLKLISSSTSSSTSEKQRIKRELVKQATLDDPHLALPIVTGEADGGLWLFREWVEGQTLRARLADGELSASEALTVTSQVARALDELHRAGLLHRDLKPEHIVLGSSEGGVESVTLLDAGLAAKIDTDSVFDVLGTPAYVSPEQAKGKLVSFRSDLYALGCVLFEMLTGAPPFEGDTPAELLAAHAETPAPEAPASLPEGARDLLNSLLAKDPRERPFSAQQVRRALDPFVPEPLRSGLSSAPARNATLLGMPAVTGSKPPEPPSGEHPVMGSASKPPPPPSMAPPKPPSMAPPVEAAPAKAEAPKPKLNPDKTQQLAAVDILEEQVLPKRAISVPPPPPSA
ncbi:MAG: serine/threonine protein kinase, partial [Deltaproteobacteria bacterium]|nr:serine/threonine protein kinase [Deltaproteobacteria bacterium]